MNPFLVVPIWNWIRRRPAGLALVLAGYFVVVSILVVLLILHGEMWTGRGAHAVFEDFRALFRGALVADPATGVPLTQDYGSMLLFFFSVPLSILTIWIQFKTFASLHSGLAENECLLIADDQKWEANVSKLNQKLRKNGRGFRFALRFMLCFGIAAGLIFMLDRPDFFDFINRADNPVDLYATWWAAPKSWYLGAGFLTVIAGYGIYLVATQLVFGMLYISFLLTNQNFVEFRPNLNNIDGYYGWWGIRKIVGTVLASMVAGGVSSLAVYIYMHAAFGIWAAVVAIIVIFVPNVVCLALAMWLYDIRCGGSNVHKLPNLLNYSRGFHGACRLSSNGCIRLSMSEWKRFRGFPICHSSVIQFIL